MKKILKKIINLFRRDTSPTSKYHTAINSKAECCGNQKRIELISDLEIEKAIRRSNNIGKEVYGWKQVGDVKIRYYIKKIK